MSNVVPTLGVALDPDNSKEVILVGYPRPSKEAVPVPVGVLNYVDDSGTQPTRFLTAYGVDNGGWEAFEWRATWRSLVLLAVITAAAYVAWSKFGIQEPSLRTLTFLLYGVPWMIGMYSAGRRRLTTLGWLVVFAVMAALLTFSLIIAPTAAEWANNVLIGWLLGPDQFVGTYDIIGKA